MPSPVRRMLGAAALAAAAAFGGSTTASAAAVNVYTSMEPELALPILDAFTDTTGISVNTIFVATGLADRLAAGGVPADLVLVEDFAELFDLARRGLTQATSSPALDASVPADFRDPAGHWYALSLRPRVIYAAADRVAENALTYEALAGPEWAGRVCMSPGATAFNTTLVAAYIAKHGEAATEQYLRALHANLARPNEGDDRTGARDIFAGLCDVSIGNSYFVGLMRAGVDGPDAERWGAAIKVIYPTFDDGLGTHVNISGAAVAANAPHHDDAVSLLEFLASAAGQEAIAYANFEYPILPGAVVDPMIEGFGPLVADPTPFADIAAQHDAAVRLIEATGFDD